MAIEPSTNLKLLKSPLTLDNKNQLTFANAQAQYNYFSSLPKIEVEEISYQRKDSVIYFDGNIDSILEYNYCMYQNENYSNKWFYAFINKMSYIADETTEIQIVTDCFQTWQFEITWKESFIEREMLATSNDIPGANLLPEGLEGGEIKVNSSVSLDDLEAVYIIAFTGDHIGNTTITDWGFEYNGIPSSVSFIACLKISLNIVLQIINNDGNGDKILTVFSIPKLAIESLVPVDPPRPNYVLVASTTNNS